MFPSKFKPRWVDSKQLQVDNYLRARPLGNLQPGDSVWVQDAKTIGTMMKQIELRRLYLLRTPTSCLRIIRRHFVSTPNAHPSVTDSPSMSCQDRLSLSPEEQPKQMSTTVMRSPVTQPVTTITRSGRMLAPPKRF